MGLQADGWIRRMAQEQGMIEPFVDGQVRDGVISYGLSSYGYDIRVTDEFKIFTNVHSAMVDPKHFNPNSFVDFKGDVCVIPPNSFVLSRTIEYFRIPRDVLTLCIGKCLTGDTRIVDAETGAYLPIAEAAGLRQTVGMKQWQLNAVAVSNFIANGKKPVYELTTNTGLRIRATANHPFRQLNGWTPLNELQPGDRIAVAGQIPVFGKTPLPEWEAVLLGLMIAEGQYRPPGHSLAFTMADPVLIALLEKCVREGLADPISHQGAMGYHPANQFGHGGQMQQNHVSLWLQQYGLKVGSRDKFVPQAIFMAPRETVVSFLRALFSGDGSVYASGDFTCLEFGSNSRRLIEDVHHLLLRFGIVSLIRSRQTQAGSTAYRIQITDDEPIARFAREIGFWPGSAKQLQLEERVLPLWRQQHICHRADLDTPVQDGWPLLRQATVAASVTLNSLGIQPTRPLQSLSYTAATPAAFASSANPLSAHVGRPLWDVVMKIEYVGEEEVFDLTVPETHNFVANDMIVHNSTYARCGLIVNVTPFEPEWQGYVTLEISNTTPLPAKVYANEGIAQVLFFRADEACETSYADRKGKYQSQQTIVLPRI